MDRNCILVIDDDFDIRLIISEILGLRGYRVAAAEDGRKALDRLHSGARPCLILLDMMMPGMNGWEFLAEHARDPALCDIPVVIFSGDGRLDESLAMTQASGFLRKPIDLDLLLKTVGAYCPGAECPSRPR